MGEKAMAVMEGPPRGPKFGQGRGKQPKQKIPDGRPTSHFVEVKSLFSKCHPSRAFLGVCGPSGIFRNRIPTSICAQPPQADRLHI